MPKVIFALALAFLCAGPAWAQSNDAPIPYPEESRPDAYPDNTPPGEIPITRRKQSEREEKNRARSLASEDDPNLGLAVELAAGLMLLDSSRGNLVEARFADGARFTWEAGRLARDISLREALFFDFSYVYVGARTGTTQVYGDTNFHDLTFAPAWAFPLGESPVALYAQVGGGVAYQFSALHVGGAETRIAGAKPLFQYGVGLRGRPSLTIDDRVRLAFRVEITRFRRGYMDDTLFLGSLGLVF